EAFSAMADMVWRPALRDLETEREVVLEEIAMYEDDPQDKVFDVLGEAVFGDHPLGRATIGRAPVISGIDRAGLAAFHRSRYRAPHVVVAAAGSVDHDRIVELVAASEGRAPDDGAERIAVDPVPPPGPQVRFVRKDTEQVHACLGGR